MNMNLLNINQFRVIFNIYGIVIWLLTVKASSDVRWNWHKIIYTNLVLSLVYLMKNL